MISLVLINIARLRELHLLILEAVCLIDLARVQKELGRDHASTLEPVIAFLRDAGAQRYLAAAEAVLLVEPLT